MPRGRRKEPENTTLPDKAATSPESVGISSEIKPASSSLVDGPLEVAAQPGQESQESVAARDMSSQSGMSGATPRDRFRSWVTDTTRGYSRKTDALYQMLVLQFDQKPSPEILSAVKEGGFHFHSDYAGHQNAWVRRNDHTGRVEVDAIEKLLRSQTPEVGSAVPF